MQYKYIMVAMWQWLFLHFTTRMIVLISQYFACPYGSSLHAFFWWRGRLRKAKSDHKWDTHKSLTNFLDAMVPSFVPRQSPSPWNFSHRESRIVRTYIKQHWHCRYMSSVSSFQLQLRLLRWASDNAETLYFYAVLLCWATLCELPLWHTSG